MVTKDQVKYCPSCLVCAIASYLVLLMMFRDDSTTITTFIPRREFQFPYPLFIDAHLVSDMHVEPDASMILPSVLCTMHCNVISGAYV